MSNNSIAVTISNQPLIDKITQLQQEISTLEETITSLNAQIADLNQQVEQKQATIDSLNLQISQLQEQINQLDAQVTALTEQVQTLTLENSQLTQQVGQLQASVQSLNEQITGMINQINAINGETVENPIEYLAQTKSDILTALQNKGSSATSSTTFRNYVQEINMLGKVGDPHTLLLLHFGGNEVTDGSIYENTLTFSSNFTRSNTIKKFGSYSMQLSSTGGNSGSNMRVSGITPPVYEFTYEFWINRTQNMNYGGGLSGNNGGYQRTFSVFYQYSGTSDFVMHVGNSNMYNAIPYNDFTLNTWHHVAYCRTYTTFYAFLDGILKGSTSVPAFNLPCLWYENQLRIGTDNATSGSWDNTYIDEFRISDVCRYTSDFTPPTEPFAS